VYGFGLYGNDIKVLHHLTQDQINTVSAASFCSGIISWLPGMVVDRCGTRFSFVAGASTCLIALLSFWHFARTTTSTTTSLDDTNNAFLVVQLSLLGMVSFMGTALIIGSVFKTIVVCSERHHKGTLVGIAKGYTGLGAGTFTCIFEGLRSQHNSTKGASTTFLDSTNLGFLPVASITTFLTIFPAIYMLPPPSTMVATTSALESRSKLHGSFSSQQISVMYLGLTMLGIAVIGISAMIVVDTENSDHDNILTEYGYLVAVSLVCIWILPSFIVAYCCLPAEDERGDTLPPSTAIDAAQEGCDEDEEDDALIATEETRLTSTSQDTVMIENNNKTDLNLSEALQTAELWLLFYGCTVVVGSGTMLTNNMGAIVQSQQLSDDITSVAMSIFSVTQAISRVVTGLVSEMARNNEQSKTNINRIAVANGSTASTSTSSSKSMAWLGWHSRPTFVALSAFLAAVAHGVLALPNLQSSGFFLAGIAICGISFGMVWPLMVLIVGEVFGKTNMGAIYMWFDGMTIAVGTVLFSITQALWDSMREHDRMTAKAAASTTFSGGANHEFQEQHHEDDPRCIGNECFQGTHIIIACMAFSAIGTSLELSRRTYQKDVR